MGFADRRMLGQLLPSCRPTGSWPENGLRGSLCWGGVRRHRILPQADCKVENGLFRDYEHPKRFVMRNLGLQLLISFLLIANGLGFAQQRRKVIINQDCSGHNVAARIPGHSQSAKMKLVTVILDSSS